MEALKRHHTYPFAVEKLMSLIVAVSASRLLRPLLLRLGVVSPEGLLATLVILAGALQP